MQFTRSFANELVFRSKDQSDFFEALGVPRVHHRGEGTSFMRGQGLDPTPAIWNFRESGALELQNFVSFSFFMLRLFGYPSPSGYGRRFLMGVQVRVPPGHVVSIHAPLIPTEGDGHDVGACGFLLFRLSVESGRAARSFRQSPTEGCLFKALGGGF